MSTAHEDLAAFQQFALQKLNAGKADSLKELFDLWRSEHPKLEDQAEGSVDFRPPAPRIE